MVALTAKHSWTIMSFDAMMGHLLADVLIATRILYIEARLLARAVRHPDGVNSISDDFLIHVSVDSMVWLEEQLEGVLREGVPGSGVRPQQALAAAREAWAIAQIIERGGSGVGVSLSFVSHAAEEHTKALAAAADKGKGAAAAATPATLPTDPTELAFRISNSALVRALLDWYRPTCSRLLAQVQDVVAQGIAGRSQSGGVTGTCPKAGDGLGRGGGPSVGGGLLVDLQVAPSAGDSPTEAEAAVARKAGEGEVAGAAQQGGEGEVASEQHLPTCASTPGVPCSTGGGDNGGGCSGERDGSCGGGSGSSNSFGGIAASGATGVAHSRRGWARLTLEQRLVVAGCQVRGVAHPRLLPHPDNPITPSKHHVLSRPDRRLREPSPLLCMHAGHFEAKQPVNENAEWGGVCGRQPACSLQGRHHHCWRQPYQSLESWCCASV